MLIEFRFPNLTVSKQILLKMIAFKAIRRDDIKLDSGERMYPAPYRIRLRRNPSLIF